jgi:hypothetical protein
MTIELCFAFSDKRVARQAAEGYGGCLYEDVKDRLHYQPFAALLCTTHSDLTALLSVADVGAYRVDRRVMRVRDTLNPTGPQPGAIGVFTLVANSKLGHDAADEHWRDKHTPLALSIHKAMSNYAQLSVLHRFKGPAWDGFALCGFESIEDLETRFFASKAGARLIAEDVNRFADTQASPRRVVVLETRYKS